MGAKLVVGRVGPRIRRSLTARRATGNIRRTSVTLKDALTQLRLYKSDLGNPPVLVVSDIARFEVYIEFTGFRTRVETFRNADLLNAATRDLLRAALTDPQRLRPSDKTVTITERVAAKFAQVAQLVERRGHDPHDVAHFFMKLVVAQQA